MLLICLPASSVTASRWLSSCYSRKLQTRLLWLTCCHHCLVLSGQTKTDVAEGLSGVETPAVSCLSQQGLRMQQKSRSYIQSYSQPVNVQPQTGTDAVFLPGNDTVPVSFVCSSLGNPSGQKIWTGSVFYSIWQTQIKIGCFCVHNSSLWPKTKARQSHTHWQYRASRAGRTVSSQNPGSLFNQLKSDLFTKVIIYFQVK